MPGQLVVIIPCLGYKQQWRDYKAKPSSQNSTYAMVTIIYNLLMKTNTKQQYRHDMRHTFLKSCTLGCVTCLPSSKEQCERILHPF
jgi:hypothetical protein